MLSRPGRRATSSEGGRKAQRVASLMGDDLVFEGNLGGDGDVHLDGLIRGDVRVQRLTLGERGCVEGAVTAETVEVHGRVVGSITARHVRLHAGAQVSGDITHEELTIDAGAIFQGRSLRPPAAAQAPIALAPASDARRAAPDAPPPLLAAASG